MGSKIYVGGLPYATTDGQLQEIFSAHGTVESARVITDKFTGRSRGFGFVEMSSNEEAQRAIQALNGTDLDGRSLTVNEARPQEKRSGFGGDRGAVARVRGKARAGGVLEQRTVDCLDEAGVSARLHDEGMVHHGIELRSGRVGAPLLAFILPVLLHNWKRLLLIS